MFGFRLGYEVVGRTTPGEDNKNSHTGNTGNKKTLIFCFCEIFEHGQDREEKEKERESEERKKERKRASGGRAAPQFWLQMGNACACDR